MAYSGGQITRLGLGGFTRGRYGSFAGKVEAEVVIPSSPGGDAFMGRSFAAPPTSRKKPKKKQIPLAALQAAREARDRSLAAQESVDTTSTALVLVEAARALRSGKAAAQAQARVDRRVVAAKEAQKQADNFRLLKFLENERKEKERITKERRRVLMALLLAAA